MQTTDPRRTPRPDSEERTQKPGAAARPLSADWKRRIDEDVQKRGR